ncbi:16046_t:CDS:2 [Funneliformis geosporum]|uniref:1948_t:CDS:1 n=1 Tax=Funneliformis geosporum TaxID=1117311 RepID=A0A9W4XAZ8_9GLOM|nr:1948_t:CDS:2 [Funneliformis geosporum]CAI2200026.1 16046_t:CDS:2 [Funneliformis geosporum]
MSTEQILCNGCGVDSKSVYFSGVLKEVSKMEIEDWLFMKPYVFTHVIKDLAETHGIVHFDTIKDASLFFYGMREKHELSDNVIKFSAAYKFGKRQGNCIPKDSNAQYNGSN